MNRNEDAHMLDIPHDVKFVVDVRNTVLRLRNSHGDKRSDLNNPLVSTRTGEDIEW